MKFQDPLLQRKEGDDEFDGRFRYESDRIQIKSIWLTKSKMMSRLPAVEQTVMIS